MPNEPGRRMQEEEAKRMLESEEDSEDEGVVDILGEGEGYPMAGWIMDEHDEDEDEDILAEE